MGRQGKQVNKGMQHRYLHIGDLLANDFDLDQK